MSTILPHSPGKYNEVPEAAKYLIFLIDFLEGKLADIVIILSLNIFCRLHRF